MNFNLELSTDNRQQKYTTMKNQENKSKDILEKSEKKYKELFEKSKDAILIIHSGKFVDCNQAAIDMLGYNSKDEFLNTHPSELSPEKQADGKNSFTKANEMMEIALKNGSHRFEWDHKKSNGEIFPVEVLLTAISTNKKNQILHTTWRDITERKRAEEKLKENEEKLSTILNSMPDVILQLDTHLKIIWANEATLKLNPNAIGQICYKALPGINYICPNCPIVKALKTGKIERGIVHLKSVTGIGESYWDDIGIPVKDAQGKIISIVKLARNVTEKMKAEAEIRKLYKVVEITPEAIVISDMEGKIEYVNPGLLSLGGFEDDRSIIGKSVFMFSNKEGVKQLKEEIIPTILSEGKWEGELPVKRKDGSIFPADFVSTMILDEEGKPKKLLANFRDITNRKKTEEELRESEARFRKLLENIPTVAVQGYDANGTINYWNKANEAIYGYTANEAIGKNLVELIIPPEMQKDVQELIKQGAKTGNILPASELTLMKKGGKPVTVFSSHAVVQQSGKEPELFCIDVDLTERKKAEEELKKYREHLEELVKERTKELEEKNKELERFNNLFVDREFRIKELRDKVKNLEKGKM